MLVIVVIGIFGVVLLVSCFDVDSGVCEFELDECS